MKTLFLASFFMFGLNAYAADYNITSNSIDASKSESTLIPCLNKKNTSFFSVHDRDNIYLSVCDGDFGNNMGESNSTVSRLSNTMMETYNGSMKSFHHTSSFLIKSSMATNQKVTADAGPDQFLHLVETSSTILNGIGTGDGLTYKWDDISTDYSSGITIVSPTSLSTQITGLKQGTFYFKFTVTDNSGESMSDTVNIYVDYDSPPLGGQLLRQLMIPDMATSANLRDDTTTNFLPGDGVSPFIHTSTRKVAYNQIAFITSGIG